VRAFASPDELMKAVGEHLGHSEWHEIGQERVNGFADATGDHQWIHVDQEAAKAGPFGTTIAHGFLTLSLVPVLAGEVYRVDNVKMGINYGLDKVRFPATVPVGSRVRAGVEVLGADEVAENAYQIRCRVTIEREGGDKPVCVAETLSRFYL
jgi:acyl dehydratase